MPFITFIYKIGKSNKTYYGKYCVNYISENHEVLYNEVKYILLKGLNDYRINHNYEKIKTKIFIGILSFSLNDINLTYSLEDEIKCFDYYYSYNNNIYVNGKIV